MAVSIVFIIIGFVLLIKGADFLVDGGSDIAKKFHIPEIVIGMTIVSIGTSMPELMVSTNSALNGHSDMSIGNVVGSNIVNLLFILAICAVIKELPYKKQTKWIEGNIAVFSTVLLLFMGNNSPLHIITRREGIFLVVCLLLFMIYNIIMAKSGEDFDEVENSEDTSDISILKSVIFILIGCIGLKFGGDFVVNNAVKIANTLGISEKIISVTIIAIGTSLPELATSVMATIKGDIDMAIRKYYWISEYLIYL